MKKDKTSISIIVPDRTGGGAQKMMFHMALDFAQRNYLVDLVIICKSKSEDYTLPAHANINVINFNKRRVSHSAGALIKYFNQQRPQHIISALTYVNLVSIFAKLLSKNTNSKLYVTERAYHSINAKLSGSKYLIEKLLIKLLYRHADFVIGISKGVSLDIQKTASLPDHMIKTIYNPVITPAINEQTKQEIEGPWFPSETSKKVIACGRLVPVKDYPTLIRAIAILRQTFDIDLGILGQGPLEKDLKVLAQELNIENHIHFFGFVRNPLPYYQKSDVFALSSVSEGFGNVIVEAMYCGTQIACTDCPSGPREILDNERYGQLSPVGDDAALAKSIEACLITPQPSAQLKERALHFSSEESCNKFEDLFREST